MTRESTRMAAEDVRSARIQLMHFLEPQDHLGMALIHVLGLVKAYEIVAGRVPSSGELDVVREERPELSERMDELSGQLGATQNLLARTTSPGLVGHISFASLEGQLKSFTPQGTVTRRINYSLCFISHHHLPRCPCRGLVMKRTKTSHF